MSDNEQDRARLKAFERDLAADPRSLVFVALAEEHNRLGEFEDAATVSQKGLVYHPDSVAGRVALAQAEAGRGNVKQALEQLKRALLIDQENAKALALMGRILLQKGLARRAVQFLGHAVKSAPEVTEYGDLLKRAKKAAANEPPPSVFRADAVRDTASPWNEDESDSEFNARAPESEHTVFDPDAMKKLKAGGSKPPPPPPGPRSGGAAASQELEEALRQLPTALDDTADAEPTRFDGRARRATVALPADLPPPRRVDVEQRSERVEAREEPTTYDAKNPLNEPRPAGRKPKMGGSAADVASVMMRAVRTPPPPPGADDVASSLPEPVPYADDGAKARADKPRTRAIDASEAEAIDPRVKAPSSVREEAERERAAKDREAKDRDAAKDREAKDRDAKDREARDRDAARESSKDRDAAKDREAARESSKDRDPAKDREVRAAAKDPSVRDRGTPKDGSGAKEPARDA
ncbi:hypothetical protein L6R52_14725, partial [Myxococcota bacterium]|nr:hypothetical protein [Myxococcota bacterium]